MNDAERDSDPKIGPHGPDSEAPPTIGAPSSGGGGLGALIGTAKQLPRMGVMAGVRLLSQINQPGGFDCPGCAWPDPDDRATTEFCENGAKAVAEEATKKRCDPTFFATHSIAELKSKTDHWLGHQGRLTHPMFKAPGATHYTPIDWADAFALIGDRLSGLETPDRAVFYTSGRTSNEAAFLYQLFVRVFGTNNLPDCSNMCHESSGIGLGQTIGIGKGTVQLDDFEAAQAIFVIGQNPGTNHPRMMSTLQKAVRKGANIVSVNPLQEPGLTRFIHPQEPWALLGRGTTLSSLHLPVRINGDVALLTGIAKVVFEADDASGDVIDRDFIAKYSDGFDAYSASVRAATWGEITQGSGLSEDQIRAAATVYIESERTIITWAMGLTQHVNGVANIQSVVNLLLLKGNIGREGAGACPVRGHSNVQGDRTMGIHEAPSEAFLDRLGAAIGFEPPRAHGFNIVHAIEAMDDGQVDVFFAMGGNFYSAAPDSGMLAGALGKIGLTVQVSTKLNRSHLITGESALILPCLGRTEWDMQAGNPQFVSVENSMGVVHRSEGRRKPPSAHVMSEPAIVAALAEATLKGSGPVDWAKLAADYDGIRDLIERSIPGFDRYNARVREELGFLLPNGAAKREFNTATGRARFTVHPIPRWDLAEGELLMMTVRTHDQYNTTIYGLDDRYRGIKGGRRVVLMNAQDIAAQGFKADDIVDVTSEFEGVTREIHGFRLVAYAIPRQCCAMYFPEANTLVPLQQRAKKSFTPASKSVVIRLNPGR